VLYKKYFVFIKIYKKKDVLVTSKNAENTILKARNTMKRRFKSVMDVKKTSFGRIHII